jgi:hypothetical protein
MSTPEELHAKKEAIVIDLFLTTHDNRVVVIAEKAGLQETTVRQIINQHLKAKVING